MASVLREDAYRSPKLRTRRFGAAAAYLSRMAGQGHRAWRERARPADAGLAACVLLSLQVTRRAWAAIGAERGATGARTPS